MISVTPARMNSSLARHLMLMVGLLLAMGATLTAAPLPPTELSVVDHPLDGGKVVDVQFAPSADDPLGQNPEQTLEYVVLASGEFHGEYTEVARARSSQA